MIFINDDGTVTEAYNMSRPERSPTYAPRLRADRISNTVLTALTPGWQCVHPTVWRYVTASDSKIVFTLLMSDSSVARNDYTCCTYTHRSAKCAGYKASPTNT